MMDESEEVVHSEMTARELEDLMISFDEYDWCNAGFWYWDIRDKGVDMQRVWRESHVRYPDGSKAARVQDNEQQWFCCACWAPRFVSL